MTTDELIKALTRMKSETGSRSFCCLGCGHEHNLSRIGCRYRIIRRRGVENK